MSPRCVSVFAFKVRRYCSEVCLAHHVEDHVASAVSFLVTMWAENVRFFLVGPLSSAYGGVKVGFYYNRIGLGDLDEHVDECVVVVSCFFVRVFGMWMVAGDECHGCEFFSCGG